MISRLADMPSARLLPASDHHFDDVPWLLDFRRQHREAFVHHGLPKTQHEQWKYADLSWLQHQQFAQAEQQTLMQTELNTYRLNQGNSILLVLINGYFMPQLSDLNKLAAGMIVMSIGQAVRQQATFIRPFWSHGVSAERYPFASLNAASFTDGLFLYVPPQCELAMPIHILSLVMDDKTFIAHPQHLIVADEASTLTILEESLALTKQPYFMNTMGTIHVGKKAHLEHISIQHENKFSMHYAFTHVIQQQESYTNLLRFTKGGLFAREDLLVQLRGEHAKTEAKGLYYGEYDQQYIDHHIEINHIAAHTHSDLFYKGILQAASRTVFNGKVIVEQGAQKIIAEQSNKNLLLSANSEAYTKPELIIHADDVRCKHGASVGQLDHDALFYLRARGINERDAINILLQGFSDEIINTVTHPGIKQKIKKVITVK